MDKLTEIFTLQKQFNDEVIKKRNLGDINQQEWIKNYAIALYVELGEFLNETNFKWWKNPKDINMPALKEELVDILHFFISLCIRCGMDADELHSMYIDKNKENILRQQGKSDKKGYEPI